MIILNKVFWTMLLFLVVGCSGESPISFESESFNLEIKKWGKKATNNNASSYSPWSGLAGMNVGYSIRNIHDVDLEIEYILNIRGARLQENIGKLFSIADSPYISSAVGVLCANTNANLDPIGIIESNTIRPGEHLFVVAFAEVDWNEWFSVYTTVIINSTTYELQKSVFKSEIKIDKF